MSESSQLALSDVREWSGGPPGCSGVVGRPYRMSRSPYWMAGSDLLALLGVLEWSRAPSGCPAVVRRLSRLSGSSLETLPDVQKPLTNIRE